MRKAFIKFLVSSFWFLVVIVLNKKPETRNQKPEPETMINIKLNQLRFFAHHGLYEEERKVANEFVVDVEVSFPEPTGVITKMSGTINYVKLYEIVKQRMLRTSDLIETLAMEICDSIHQQFPQVKKLSISITKKYPPVINFSGNVAISFVKEF